MTDAFTILKLHPELVQAVAERGYVAPTPIQAGVIPAFSTPVVQMRDPEPEGPPEGQGPQPEDKEDDEEVDFSDPSLDEETKA